MIIKQPLKKDFLTGSEGWKEKKEDLKQPQTQRQAEEVSHGF